MQAQAAVTQDNFSPLMVQIQDTEADAAAVKKSSN